MKSAEELFNEYSCLCAHVWAMPTALFIEALAKHDKEIVNKIDEMLEKHGLTGDPYWLALTELKQIVEGEIK